MAATSPFPGKVIHVAAAAIFAPDGQLLIARRPDHAHQGGLWEFPGGKVEPQESVLAALARELYEEVGIHVRAARPLIRVPHMYSDKTVLLDVWRVTAFDGTPEGREGQPLRWIRVADLQPKQFPAANVPIIDALQLPDAYLITGDFSDQADFFLRLERALARGVKMVQFRANTLALPQYRSWVPAVAERCQAASARLILNGDPQSLADLPAQGIHLSGKRLADLAAADLHNWAGRWIGASCHSSEQLQQAVALGARYASLSPVLPTRSHPETAPLGWQRFAAWVDAVPLPVYALGGMQPEHISQAVDSGGQGIAAIGSYWD